MLVIDAANVLHAAAAQPWPISELEPEGLVRLVASLRLGRRGAVLVFDGVIPINAPSDPPESHGVRLTWSGAEREADDVIEELLVIDTAPSRVRVVSTDRRLRNAAKRAGATSEPSADFLHRVYDEMIARGKRLPPPKIRQEVPLDRAMLEMWLEEFGFDPALARLPGTRGTGTRGPGTRGTGVSPVSPLSPRNASPRNASPRSVSPRNTGGTPVPRAAEGSDPDEAHAADAANAPPQIDTELAALLKMWGESLSEADLNMQLWLETHPPPDDPSSARP